MGSSRSILEVTTRWDSTLHIYTQQSLGTCNHPLRYTIQNKSAEGVGREKLTGMGVDRGGGRERSGYGRRFFFLVV